MSKYHTRFTKEYIQNLPFSVDEIAIYGITGGKNYRAGELDMIYTRSPNGWIDINGNFYDSSKLAKDIQLRASEIKNDGQVLDYKESKNTMRGCNKKLKGFNSAVYGKSLAKKIKKNPRKTGKKMKKAWRDML